MTIAPGGCPLCGSLTLSHVTGFLYRCDACRLVLNQRSESRHQEETLYRESERPFDTPPEVVDAQWQWFSRALPGQVSRPGTLLDVGCGTGGFLLRAREAGWTVRGLELNPVNVQMANQRLGGGVDGASLYDWSPDGAGFDAITLWDVLDHLVDPALAVRQLHAWLQPGGVLIVRVRNAWWHVTVLRLYERCGWLFRMLGLVKAPAVVHRYGFTLPPLLKVLHEAGLADVQILPVALTPGNRSGVWAGPGAAAWLTRTFAALAETLARLSGHRLYLGPSILVSARKTR